MSVCRRQSRILLTSITRLAQTSLRVFASDASQEPSTRTNATKSSFRVTDFSQDRIRNFSIIAHVDHGKSTLADRLMEMTGAIRSRQKEQYLDKLQVERERGITVKAQSVSLVYEYGGTDYLLNLIDTPGHVDFSYEVSRSIAACQGAILLVDATQGIQAQTVANFHLAFEQGLEILPVINKIDMDAADPDKVTSQLRDAFGILKDETLLISAKTGQGVQRVLDKVIDGDVHGKLRVLLFDAYHDEYRGVICLVEVIDGALRKGMRITSVASGESHDVLEVGVLSPEPVPSGELLTGQVGYVIASGMKSTRSAQIGDTLHLHGIPVDPLPGFASIKCNVFSGIYPTNTDDFDHLQSAVDRLTLNDASVTVRRESSVALGYGFRCGFLGMLHLDVFCDRLSQEHGVDVIVTTPTVPYKITLSTGEERSLQNPCDFPMNQKVKCVQEPTVCAAIVAPEEYTGAVMELCSTRRELAENFFSDLKSLTNGYASLDYQEGEYREADLQRLDILVNGKPVDAFARILHKYCRTARYQKQFGSGRDRVVRAGRQLCQKLKSLMDRQQFEIIIQASSNGRIVCRETISALRKNVLAKCYGGDITRKKKLLEKQKEGKKRMKSLGTVTLPQEAFYELVKLR